MSRATLVNDVGEWLVDQALSEPDIVEMFENLCHRLYGIGVPIARARLTWPTLHPLFGAETILWKSGKEIEFEQFRHQDDVSESWQRSPMAYMFENGVAEMRRNLDGPNKMVDFDILQDMIDEGMTDYLIVITSFDGKKLERGLPETKYSRRVSGLILTWACDRPGGFTDDDIVALKQIQRRFAVAVKTVIQRRISANITETYLGRQAGLQVLDGKIKLGDGQQTEAVVWYSDMRNSTALADTMAAEDFIKLLNEYFSCTAAPAIELGGEVLDFIGDAVLAIFPYEGEDGKHQAIRCATMAMEMALDCLERSDERRKSEGLQPFDFGIAINAGVLTFGNIGVDQRLSFSVIGPTINEATRIEALTKSVDSKALVSREITETEPERWTSAGLFRLNGVAHECELFVPRGKADAMKVPHQSDLPRVSVN
ncbi:MAG: adenylate/guanylate cyclase domain-containing protein [Ahrensia sp.]|nr:adenylate/guanylate cyclase domain-containing protein [Ahrensia sp.]